MNYYPKNRKSSSRSKYTPEERLQRRRETQRRFRERHRNPDTPPRLKHGHTIGGKPTPTYWSWWSMRRRCLSVYAKDYKRYGGLGVTICDRWVNSFTDFLADMGERPPGKTLDRYPNRRGNYEPGNCRWATPKEQAQQRREPMRSTNTSGFVGVYWDKKSHKWEVRKKQSYYGKFTSFEAAVDFRKQLDAEAASHA